MTESPFPEEEKLYGVLDPNIRRVCLGDYEFDTWYGNAVYFAPDESTLGYEYSNRHLTKRASRKPATTSFWLDTLYLCDQCFKYSDKKIEIDAHRAACAYRARAPGKVLYRGAGYEVRRVRGCKHPLFCQNLSLFGKLFLDNKSVFFSVETFEFYVVYGYDGESMLPMGFFSKELLAWEDNNLACIVVFPPFQRRRLGTLLIEFSYALSCSEGRVSGPELPLSQFGRVAYVAHWCKVLARAFMRGAFKDAVKVKMAQVSTVTGLRYDDALMALRHMGAIEGREVLRGNIEKWVEENRINLEGSVLEEGGLVVY
ncbi:hypothetical protein BABINDRAFT_6203 [Babjeviella inositovora NRRL Y-12698]|uniref:histone acetyltransferase n=1 Tax=Babjeviella inositovora NRRL Y-12698 TaxID=984486 RepID=A0A1E3QV33_9ASCO|nr:uncharacterized protein BABINDRAFT_6203 [Babjeviella inositovora NRRL Y-12698]ODQ81515.1 hypothetical protein BABINDRAFT_6203 [Babjeviella inositovora NRRL Y-12698]